MAELPGHPEAVDGERVWEGFDDTYVYLQRVCTECEHGLQVAPARWCDRCGGSGFLTRTVPLGTPPPDSP